MHETTIEILTAAGLDMCGAGRLFAINHEDPHAAITLALADRHPSDPACRPSWQHDVRDFAGWEFLRYTANHLPECEPCGRFTWPDTAEETEAATVRAAVNLRWWLEHRAPGFLASAYGDPCPIEGCGERGQH